MHQVSPAAEEGTHRRATGSQPLADALARWTDGKHRFDTPIPGLSLHRWDRPTEPTSYLLAPSLCLIGQGRKRLFLGEETYVYDANQFLITAVDLPVVTQIIEASAERPYLGLTMELDLRGIAQLMRNDQPAPTRTACLGVAVSAVSPALLDAVDRLLALIDHPDDIQALAPLVQQEIAYRLLTGEQGPRLRHIVAAGQQGYQIARAVDWLKEHFDQPLRIETLATQVGLSPSAFHSHFRSTTAMSPLQFQKRLRLNEARRLMLTEQLDASRAAFQVGYESPSQFSREYRRQFGAPPTRDIKHLLRNTAG